MKGYRPKYVRKQSSISFECVVRYFASLFSPPIIGLLGQMCETTLFCFCFPFGVYMDNIRSQHASWMNRCVLGALLRFTDHTFNYHHVECHTLSGRNWLWWNRETVK